MVVLLVATFTVIGVLLAVLLSGAVIDGRRHGVRIRVTPGAGAVRAADVFSRWTGQSARPHGDATLDDPGASAAPPDSRGQRAGNRMTGIAAGAADGAIIAAHGFLSVDPAVFEAATQAAHTPVDNLLDLPRSRI